MPTVCSSCGKTSGHCVTPLVPVPGCRRAQIRDVLLANGFTIKPGNDDLKPYVYAAVDAVLDEFVCEVTRPGIAYAEEVAKQMARNIDADLTRKEQET